MMKRITNIGLGAIALILVSQQTIAADAELKAQFKQAYNAYLSAQENHEPLEQTAEQAYVLGSQVYGNQANNTANLAINYAASLPANSQQQTKLELYQKAYEILKANQGEHDISLIDPLIGLAETVDSAKKADDYLDDAIAIAKQQNSPKLVADIKLSAAKVLAYKEHGKRYLTAKNYLEEADEYYQQHVAANSVERMKADFLMAAFAEGKKQYDVAITRLNHVVSVFDEALSYDHQAELQAHSKLVYLYEKTGQSDEATKHCVAIAKMVPWKESQEQVPLYRQEPKYPMSKARFRQDGSVQMEFEVSPTGFVKNIQVIDSKGGEAFERAAIEAMEKWRYAPKFENGQAIAATSRVQLDFKIN